MRSPFLAAAPPVAALIAGLARWGLQGSHNLYTQTARRYYVADPDLGWRAMTGGPPWLGLELLGIVLGITCAVVVGAWIVRRLERTRPRRGWRTALWIAGASTLIVPAWAFAGGLGPSGARDTLPIAGVAADFEGIAGALDAPAGTWTVITHPGAAITARVSAGGEAFDARFAGDLGGSWTGDPHDLRAPMSAEISVAVASVDTGVAMRSKSVREDYLDAATYPAMTFSLTRLRAARPAGDAPSTIASPGSAGARSTASAVRSTIASPGSAGARSTASAVRSTIASPGSAGARSTASAAPSTIASPGSAGARSTASAVRSMIDLRADGVVGLAGRRHDVAVSGTLTVLDDAARRRLGLDPATPAMLVEADLQLTISETVLAPDAGDFDGDTIPVHASLILVHRSPS